MWFTSCLSSSPSSLDELNKLDELDELDKLDELDDHELALAFKVSREESGEEALLQRVLARSMDGEEKMADPGAPKKALRQEQDPTTMTEEEQIVYAIQMSMAEAGSGEAPAEENVEKEGGAGGVEEPSEGTQEDPQDSGRILPKGL